MLNKKLSVTALAFVFFGLSGCFAPRSVKKSGTPEKPRQTVEIKEETKKTTEVSEVKVIKEVMKQEEIPAVQPRKMSPYVMREFRAAWVATVANINWPSKAGLSTAQQQKEALELLDFLQKHNYNAVIFQVRPQADALYSSSLEPWSVFLSGEQGKAPQPYYDPLHFWIEAAHDRGMELHVWLNPYRAHHSTGGKITEASIVKKNPELVVPLKNGMWWMDPSKKETQDHTAAVVMDIVKRYDIDGVHFDDYFYPYASYNKGEDFPDAASYAAYKSRRGTLARDDWRRQSVNDFVKRIYGEIKAENPKIKFGISPFGIYRPGYPRSITGMDQYSELYADARLWLNEGWVDYYSPQLYWKISQAPQSFPVLLGWWENENHQNRHLWPGINIDFGGDDPNLIETVSQIMITRGMVPESKGTIHWSIGPLVKYPALASGILERAYKKQALVPESPWLNPLIPAAPVVKTAQAGDRVQISWTHPHQQEVFQWVVHYKYKGKWDYKVLNRTRTSAEFALYLNDGKDRLTHIGVTAVDRTGNQSDFHEKEIEQNL